MPTANMAVPVKYMWMDHDPAYYDANPPVQNQWYTLVDVYDVRVLTCFIDQSNTGAVLKTVEVKWTIDGHVYFVRDFLNSGVQNFVYKEYTDSVGGTKGLSITDLYANATFYVDKRGHHFKVEFRMIDPPGVNQDLEMYCVYETLEQVAP